MALTWTKENSPRWDADKQRVLGPAELAAAGLAAPSPGEPVANEWWRVTDGDEVAGYGWLDSEWGDARITFVVAPGRRGRGVGAFILEHLEDEAAARGLNYIYNVVPETHPDGAWIRNWLSTHGFHEASRGQLRRQVVPSARGHAGWSGLKLSRSMRQGHRNRQESRGRHKGPFGLIAAQWRRWAGLRGMVSTGFAGMAGGLSVSGASAACGRARAAGWAARSKKRSSSTGTGMTRVLFFSAATSTTVCRSRSCRAAGSADMMVAACASFLDAWIFAVGRDDPRAALAFGFGLAGHRSFHRFRQGDVLDLDPLHPDTPGFLGGGVDDLLELGVDLVPFGQQLVQVAVADHRSQRRLGDLGHREGVVLHVDERLDRVDDPVVDDRVHPHRDVVAGDALLAGHGRRDDLHVDLAQPVSERVNPGQPRLA